MINRNLMFKPENNIFQKDTEEISRPVKTFIDPSLNNIKYGEKLEELLNELGIKYGDFAKSIGMTRDNLAEIRNGIKARPLKDDIKAIINLALNKEMYYKGYKHMPAEEFGKLFAELWEEFKSDIIQEDFAVKAGHNNQSHISQKKTGDELVRSTKEQYDYLLAFYDLCKRRTHYWFSDRNSGLEFYTRHREAAAKLEKLLFGSPVSHDTLSDNENNDEELSVTVINTVIEHLITLPQEAQKLILSYPYAFFDSLAAPNFHHSDGSYISAGEFIERFRQLTKDERLRFYNDMQKLNSDEKINNYIYNSSDWFLFDINLHYQNMINNARHRNIADPIITGCYNDESDPIHDISLDSFRSDKKNKKIDSEKQRYLFEGVISSFDKRCWKNRPKDIITDTIIDDIEYRLNMSPFEWHLWALYASYVYTFHSDKRIEVLFNKTEIEQGLSVIADHIISLPFDKQEKICLNPMFFFDSMALCSINYDSKSSVVYLKAQMLFEQFDALSDGEKQQFINKTKDFRDMSSDYAGYPIRCDYYDNYKEIPVYGNAQTQKDAIMEFLFYLTNYTSDETAAYKELAELVIDDISYKLSMSQEQWDIWCLFIETVYNMSFGSSKAVSALEVLNRIIEAVKKQ
ncbi:hypothetical protein [Ruminococcus sp. NK3A76]|uniref:hypothetical protein n=1 Tax=Ruminococcus sp. NK3A76 TaxID=877411 RepID=UPI00048B939C|nr:hypothetical protein [Ruminococcus sp. NK3A76]